MTSGYQARHTSLSQEERQEKLSQADLTSAKGGIRRRVDIVDNSEVEISNLEVETFQKHPDQVCLKGKRSSMVSRSRYLKKLPSELRMEMTLQWRRMNCLSLPTQTPSTKADLLLDDEVSPGYPDIVLILKLFTKVLVKQFPIDKKWFLPNVKGKPRLNTWTDLFIVTSQPQVRTAFCSASWDTGVFQVLVTICSFCI